MPNRRMIMPILAALVVIGGVGALSLSNATLAGVVANDQQVITTLSQNNDALREQVKDSGETPVAPPADVVTDSVPSAGQQGDRGPRGEKGDPGEDATGTPGIPGSNGADGIGKPGTNGDAGPAGPQGPQGVAGAQGEQGNPGALPSPLVFTFPSGNTYTCNLNSTTQQYDCTQTLTLPTTE